MEEDLHRHESRHVAGVRHESGGGGRVAHPGGHDMSQMQAPGGHDHMSMVEDYRRRFWASLALTVPILVLSPSLQGFLGLEDQLRFSGDAYLVFLLSSVVFFYGGYPFLAGFISEIRARQPGMMVLISVAITTAYVYSSAVTFGLSGMVFFWELATLVDVMLLGHWLEMKSVMGASRALEELARLMPAEAHRLLPDGGTEDVPLEALSLSDRVLVKPGEKVPVDGVVISGLTSVNEAMLTGESKPVSRRQGEAVIGGSINGEGSITVEVNKLGKDSFLSQVIELVRQAQESKSKTQDLANRAAQVLTLVALGGGLITLAIWLGFSEESFAFALERTVTVMVIACPHALGLAVPLVVAVSTALAAQNGLLIRDRAAFERARNTQAIIFDKTGTLTEGRFGVTDVVSYTAPDQEILTYAASVEAHSEHPIAKGIVAATQAMPVTDFKAIPGKGAQGVVNGRHVKVVSPGYLREARITFENRNVARLAEEGKTVVYVLVEEQVAGAIALADIVRPESSQAIAMLKAAGIRCMMLTGDNRQAAEWVAGQIGLDEFFAEVLPQEKVDKVKEVQARGLIVAMTGDGVNDAPALAQADVGIAVGAGTDVAIETADIILVKSNPLDVTAILGLTRATYRKMLQNLLWATGYNAFAIPLAAGVLSGVGILLTPAVGAALMSASTVIVAINARMLRFDRGR